MMTIMYVGAGRGKGAKEVGHPACFWENLQCSTPPSFNVLAK
jgi:hypothetical protein